jgi:hypothetical protein
MQFINNRTDFELWLTWQNEMLFLTYHYLSLKSIPWWGK